MAVDNGDDVAEVVGNTGGKTSDGFDTLRAAQLLIEVLVTLARPRGFDGALHGNRETRKTILSAGPEALTSAG